MTAKTFDTRLYRTTHGHTPRGHGMWAFERAAQPGQPPTDQPVFRTGTYTDAKRQLPAGRWVVLP